MVTQTQFFFSVTAATRPLCLPLTTKTAGVSEQVAHRTQNGSKNHCHGGSRVAVVAKWRHSVRHSDRSVDVIGSPKEAEWWYKGDRSSDWYTMFKTVSIFLRSDQWLTPVHAICDHGDAGVFSSLLCATCGRPTSSATLVRLFWTC